MKLSINSSIVVLAILNSITDSVVVGSYDVCKTVGDNFARCEKLSESDCDLRDDCRFVNRDDFQQCITDCTGSFFKGNDNVKLCKKADVCKFITGTFVNDETDCSSILAGTNCDITTGCEEQGTSMCVETRGVCDFKAPKREECPNSVGMYQKRCPESSKCTSLAISKLLCETYDEGCLFVRPTKERSGFKLPDQCFEMIDEGEGAGCPGSINMVPCALTPSGKCKAGFADDCPQGGEYSGCYFGGLCKNDQGNYINGCCDCEISREDCFNPDLDDRINNPTGRKPLWLNAQLDSVDCSYCLRDRCKNNSWPCPPE